MKKLLLLFSALALSVFAQSADTAVFVAALSPDNEVPAITGYAASGTAVLYAHAVRDAQGQIVSGSVDFVVFHNFPDTPTVTGLHVHNGPAGVNAGVVITTGISGANPVVITTARGIIERQAQVLATDAPALAALRGMFETPNAYYANLHTTVYPGGIIRGQLYRAERTVLLGRMRPQNEIPVINDFAGTALGSVEAIRGYDANFRYIAGATTFSIDYTVPEPTTFNGFHIHGGGPTVKALGLVQRKEMPYALEGVEVAIRAGEDPTLAKGGKRQVYFDPKPDSPGYLYPILVVTTDADGKEVEYYFFDQLKVPCGLTDADWNPATLGKKK